MKGLTGFTVRIAGTHTLVFMLLRGNEEMEEGIVCQISPKAKPSGIFFVRFRAVDCTIGFI